MVVEMPTGASPSGDDPDRTWSESRCTPTDAGGVSADSLFEALANPRRRFLIEYLLRRDEPVSVDALIERLAAWETDTPIDELSSADRTPASVSLRHTHLPNLTDAGIVAYDDESRTLAPGPSVEVVEPHLAILAARRSR